MKTESYINKIIVETGLTRKEIETRVEEKKKELKGLISEEGALFVIAKELGVDVKEENKDLLKDIEINISDITPQMKNITLIGRIKEIYRVNEFKRKEGSIGHVGSFLLYDNTGDIRITLWDDDTKIFKDNNFEQNELVKILNGYAKQGKSEKTEIHLGRLGKLILSPEDVDYKKYPKIQNKSIPIKIINLNDSSVSIEGSIFQIFPVKEFTKKDGTGGKVRSLNLIDSSGSSIRVTFWNGDTEKTKDLKMDDFISVTNLRPKLSTLDSKTIELHANNYSTITKKAKKIKIEGEIIEKIEDLQNKNGIVSFQGVISSLDNLKEVTLKAGDDVSLLGFTVSDDTGGIRVTLWREKADEFSEILKVGDGILFKNVMLKYSSFSDRNEISLIKDSIIEKIDLKIQNIKGIISEPRKNTDNFTGNYKKIDSIQSPGIVEIKGFLAKEINKINSYEACTNCNKKVDNCTCTNKGESVNRLILNATIDDGTSTIRVVFGSKNAEKLIGEKADIIVKLKETPDYETFLEKKSSELLGKDIIIKGRAKFSDFSNSYEISAFDFTDINISDELDKVMKEIET